MISPIQIVIKGYPRNESEDLDRSSLSPISININDYPIFYYFNSKNPLSFDIAYIYNSIAKIRLNVKPSDSVFSNLFSLDCVTSTRQILNGNFDTKIFLFDNKLKAVSNYYIRDGFIKSSKSLVPHIELKVLFPAGKMTASTSNSATLVDYYQIKSNLLRDWDDLTLADMDNLTNENIAGTVV